MIPTRVLAVANQKGGSGKTTMAVNLAVAMGGLTKRVLVVDLDPQADASNLLGVAADRGDQTLYDVMTGACELPDATARDVAPGVDLVVGTDQMAKVELTLAGEMMRERFLAGALADHIGAYDVVLIDCPPNLGLLTVNALVAATEVLIVLSMTDRNALKGAIALLETIRDLQAKKIDISITGVLRNGANPSRRTYRALNDALTDMAGQGQLPLLDTEIPLRTDFHNATTAGRALVSQSPDSIGAEAVRSAALEILERTV
jgi:chromosome partitioning protein